MQGLPQLNAAGNIDWMIIALLFIRGALKMTGNK